MDTKAISQLFQEHTDQVRTILEKANQKLAGTEARLDEMEQKMARGRHYGGEPAAPQTWGQQFVDAPELKNFANEHSRPGRFRLEVKSTITSAEGSGGALAPAQRDTLVAMPRRRMTIRNLLPTIGVSSGSVEYPQQTERTNNADVVAEGALKPESAYGFDIVSTPIRTIAHWVPATRQILDDAPQLMGLIDTELRYGLELKEEQQLLYGSGTGQNLLGMVTQATAFSAPFAVTSPNLIDTIGLAILQNALADLPADGIVVHPSDWMRMRLLKDGDGKYILGDPGSNVAPVLFGLPVVATPAMTIDKFLVGNFQAAATLYDRWAPRVEVSTEHADFFVRNLVAVLAEERIGLAVKQAKALTYGDFGLVT
jgi:HK97 family phage major capsid protein